MTTTFRYDKESIFKEFEIAKQKDIALSKKKLLSDKENDIHKNRIKTLQEYIELENQSPEVFDDVNINFQNLLVMYQSKNPRDMFYKKVFNKSYAEKREESRVKTMRDYSVSEKVNHAKDEVLEV